MVSAPSPHLPPRLSAAPAAPALSSQTSVANAPVANAPVASAPSVTATATADQSTSKGDEDDDARWCVICFERPKTHVLVPCGHLCLCQGCSELVLSERSTATAKHTGGGAEAADDAPKCPMCRADATTALRVHFS